MIYPAIDLLGGACVRLYQGSYDRVTEHDRDPVAVARRFVSEGARALHIVDLDGARAGRPVNGRLVRRLLEALDVPVQVGGGIRSEEDAAAYLGAGAARVILGTAAALEPELLRRLVGRHGPGRVAAAVDVREGRPMVRGWLEAAGLPLPALLATLRAASVTTVVYTDTKRDGTLGSPDLEGVRRLAEEGFETIAAGGISSAGDVLALARAGATGAVLGSALYRGALTLQDALTAC